MKNTYKIIIRRLNVAVVYLRATDLENQKIWL